MNFQTYPLSQRSIASILSPTSQIVRAIATKQYVLPIAKLGQLTTMTPQTYPLSQRSLASILPPPTRILQAITTKQYVLPITKLVDMDTIGCDYFALEEDSSSSIESQESKTDSPPSPISFLDIDSVSIFSNTKSDSTTLTTPPTTPEKSNERWRERYSPVIPIVPDDVEHCNERKVEEISEEILAADAPVVGEPVALPSSQEGAVLPEEDNPVISSEKEEVKKTSKLRRIKEKGLKWMGKTFKSGRVTRV